MKLFLKFLEFTLFFLRILLGKIKQRKFFWQTHLERHQLKKYCREKSGCLERRTKSGHFEERWENSESCFEKKIKMDFSQNLQNLHFDQFRIIIYSENNKFFSLFMDFFKNEGKKLLLGIEKQRNNVSNLYHMKCSKKNRFSSEICSLQNYHFSFKVFVL